MSALRSEPDLSRLDCWCKGWGHFYNSAFEPPQLTICGNCQEAAKEARLAAMTPEDRHAYELDWDLRLARLGDYPGAEGCKRIAAAYDALLEMNDAPV